MPQSAEDRSTALLSYILDEWRGLDPLGGVSPPRGLWILAHQPIPSHSLYSVQPPVAAAWFGNSAGIHTRDVDRAARLLANVAAWQGIPYSRWGRVDFAPRDTEPVYYLTFHWGGRYGYGLLAAVTASGVVLTSTHLWRS